MKKFTRERTRNFRHTVAWMGSLLALPIAIVSAIKGTSPLQVALWLMVIVSIQLLRLLPEALELREVYNDDEI